MKQGAFVLAFIAVLCAIPFISALEVTAGKSSYLPGETFQAQVQGEFSKPLTVGNIFFYDDHGKEIALAFYLIELARAKDYYVYVDVPDKAGMYAFSIKNALYYEDAVLKGTVKETPFQVNESIALQYQKAIDEIENEIQFLSLQDTALAAEAFSFDAGLAAKLKNSLISSSQNSSCWPKSGCMTEETALALQGLKKLGAADSTWLVDARNDLETGLWNLQINSNAAQVCEQGLNNDSDSVNLSAGSNTFTLDLKSKPQTAVTITLNCSSPITATVVHTYLGSLHNFPLSQQNSFSSVVLNNKKCYGKQYRTSCDIEATAYAARALSALSAANAKTTTWLEDNAVTTKEKAIAFALANDNTLEEWLVNNQHGEGYFASLSLAESEIPNYESTVYAAYALEKQKNAAGEKSRTWLQNEVDTASLTNRLLAFSLLFANSSIESLIALSPGIVQTQKTTAEIELTNKGVSAVNVSLVLAATKEKQEISLAAGTAKKVTFNISKVKANSSILVSYPKFHSEKAEAGYTVPLLLMKSEEETADNDTSILPEHFRFSQKEMHATLLAKQKITIEVLLQNVAPKAIKDITLTFSRDLKGIVTLQPVKIAELDAGVSQSVNITFETAKTGNFSGVIEAKSSQNTINTSLNISLIFTKNESLVNTTSSNAGNGTVLQNKTCKQYGGILCADKEICEGDAGVIQTADAKSCCLGSCTEKSKLNVQVIGIGLILIAFVIIGIFLLLKLRKPKKEMKDVLTEIEKKYDKFSPPQQLRG